MGASGTLPTNRAMTASRAPRPCAVPRRQQDRRMIASLGERYRSAMSAAVLLGGERASLSPRAPDHGVECDTGRLHVDALGLGQGPEGGARSRGRARAGTAGAVGHSVANDDSGVVTGISRFFRFRRNQIDVVPYYQIDGRGCAGRGRSILAMGDGHGCSCCRARWPSTTARAPRRPTRCSRGGGRGPHESRRRGAGARSPSGLSSPHWACPRTAEHTVWRTLVRSTCWSS